MADRVTKVTLNAVVNDYVAGMEKAARATKAVPTEAAKLERTNEVLKTSAKVAVTAGTAVLALGAAALKTGIDYNTLQQRSRAALTTLLGSAEAANAQMDKLDEFARTSPFAKSTFITAQQQMLGFGVAAKDVLPALDAIQDAVAAMGGGNEQISALSEILSRVKSEGRLSGDALQRLGYYGIDAAAIIGSQMGKTSVQIRDMASKPGGIPVDQIWDPLVAGLEEKFGGAADNVKQTFEGAVDRVKAAWRDFSSELAKPLVDPNGGGALVDLLNWSADMLRGFQALPEPVKATTSALTFGTAAVAALGGAAVLAIPKVVAFKASLEALNVSTVGLKGSLGALVAVGGAGVVGAWGASMTKQFIDAQREAAGLKDTVDSLTDSLDEIGTKATVDSVVGDGLGKLTDGGIFSEILRGAESFLDTAEDSSLALQALGTDGQLTSSKLKTLDATMAQLVGSGNTGQAAALYRELASRTNGSKDALSALDSLLPQYMSSQDGAADATGDAASEMETFTSQAEVAVEAVDAFVESLRGLGDTQLSLNEANRKVQDSLDSFNESIASNGQTLDITTEAGRANQSALDAIAQSYKDAAAATVENTGKQADAIPVIQQGRDEVIAAGKAAGLSQKAAEAYADSLGLIPSDVQTKVDLQSQEALRRAEEFARKLASIPNDKTVYLYVQEQRSVLTQGQQGQTFANGGMQVYANANGNMHSGFYSGGRPLYKFAEPETRWEAFISGKPGQESRNRGIALEAYERLGGNVARDMDGGSGGALMSVVPTVLRKLDEIRDRVGVVVPVPAIQGAIGSDNVGNTVRGA